MMVAGILGYIKQKIKLKYLCNFYNILHATDVVLVENFLEKMLDFVGVVIYYNINIIWTGCEECLKYQKNK